MNNTAQTKRRKFTARPVKKMWVLQLVCITLFITTCNPGYAQLKRYALPKKPTAASAAKSTAARIQDDTPLALPFWDDFSSYSVNDNQQRIVNSAYWVNSQSVWLNSGMAINEPTVNVVTFDGLDSTNLPYNPTQILINGFTDQLVSKPIDLAVASTSQDSVYLSFFYQWQGNGEAPDRNDFLLLEFKDNTSKWQEALKIFPGDNPDAATFIYAIVKVTSIFQHNNFQFRFRSYGRQSGPFDSWNLDYIYLNANRTANDRSFPDRALASEIPALFDRYGAVPINHFFTRKLLDSIKFEVKNLKNEKNLISVNFIATAQFKKYYASSTTPVVYTATGDSTAINNTGGLIDPLERVFVKSKNFLDPHSALQFDSLASHIEIKLHVALKTGDDKDKLKKRFGNLDFKLNDSTSSFYSLADYYAYDDGTAEYSVGLTQPGNFAACAFNTLTSDTLTGFDVYFPDFAVASNLSTRFYVFDDNNGEPGSILRQTTVTVQRSGLNKFKRIALTPTVVYDRFYIGWSETTANPVKVGLDMSNDTEDQIFVKVNEAWSQNTLVHGSLMIRPVFGPAGVISGITEPPPTEVTELTEPIEIYPNPNAGSFMITGKYNLVNIINATGQTINYSAEETVDGTRVSLPPIPGLYVIQFQQGSSVRVLRKVVVR